VQALWEMIVDNYFYYPSVIDMWEHLFDDINYSDTLDVDEVYNPTKNESGEYDESNDYFDYNLIRKLITPEMNERIKEINSFYNEEIEQINDEYLHLDHKNENTIKEHNAKRRRYLTSYEKSIEPINAEFEEHFRSVPMTENEIKYFMENFSESSEEFGAGSQILTSWDIREVKIDQHTQTQSENQ
jgi:hypothetical protein